MNVCGVVLSGGKSTRMGEDKSLLPIQGKKAITHVVETLKKCSDDVIVIANDPETYDFLNLRIHSDRYVNKGPLAGLESALHYEVANIYMVAACDMPFISCDVYYHLAEQLDEFDAVIPVFEGREHPLSGVYKRSVLPYIQKNIEQNQLRMNSFYNDVKVKLVDTFPNINNHTLMRHFFNMNHPEEYKQAKQL